MKRIIFLDNEPLPDDGDTYVEVPKGNDRMWSVTLVNRGRTQAGTLTIWRMRALYDGIRKRYSRCAMSPKNRPNRPIVVRSRKYGHIIATIRPLDGPVASVATKQ